MALTFRFRTCVDGSAVKISEAISVMFCSTNFFTMSSVTYLTAIMKPCKSMVAVRKKPFGQHSSIKDKLGQNAHVIGLLIHCT